MRYEIQWFPKGEKTSYDINLLYEATKSQKNARDVQKVPYTGRYGALKKTDSPEVVQFTVTGGYESGYEVVAGVKQLLSQLTKSSEPQGISIRAISTVERKKSKIKTSAPKRKPKCGCKK